MRCSGVIVSADFGLFVDLVIAYTPCLLSIRALENGTGKRDYKLKSRYRCEKSVDGGKKLMATFGFPHYAIVYTISDCVGIW